MGIYKDAATFLYTEGYDPISELYTISDFHVMWRTLTGDVSYDFQFMDDSSEGYEKEGNNFKFPINQVFDVVCHRCNTIVTTSPYKMLDNYIKKHTWCGSCIAKEERLIRERMAKDRESNIVLADNSWSNDRSIEKNYKLIPEYDEAGRPTGRVVMRKRTEDEKITYEFDQLTKGSYSRNIRETGTETGITHGGGGRTIGNRYSDI